ncbi:MAG: hypothetical protein QW102_00780 [Candidatus Nezhaarchaeales archaeon]
MKVLLFEDSPRSKTLVEMNNSAESVVQRVPRRALLENIDNWNKPVFLPEQEIVETGSSVLKGNLVVIGIEVPLAKLNGLITSISVVDTGSTTTSAVIARKPPIQ